jgi:thermopsin
MSCRGPNPRHFDQRRLQKVLKCGFFPCALSMLPVRDPRMWTIGVAVIVLVTSWAGVAGGVHLLPAPVLGPKGSEAIGSLGIRPTAATAQAPAGLSQNAEQALSVLNNVPQSAIAPSPLAANGVPKLAAPSSGMQIEYPPRAGATPAEVHSADATGRVVPLYNQTPAPMGVAEYGLRSGAGGVVTPFLLNTTSLFADLSANSLVANELFSGDPSYYGLQLNAVTTNVTVLGQDNYSYWAQDVFHYDSYSHTIDLVTNLWNFSAGTGALGSKLIYAHGPYGVAGANVYAAGEVICCVSFPYNVQLYLNSTVLDGRNVVNFTANVESPMGTIRQPSWDYVVFNSIASGGAPVRTPSNYTADGFAYNPLNLTDDFEADLIGPSGGNTNNFIGANATLSLQYLNASTSTYEPVPSAFSYGGETGETSYGLSEAWKTGAGGPGGANTYAVISTGGSELKGLWNMSTPEGATPVTVDVTPSNALVFLNQSASNSTVNEAAWAPAVLDGDTYELSPGTYTLTVSLSGYTPTTGVLVVGASPVTKSITLSADAALGVYAPIYVWNNNQFAAISSGGAGTNVSPYLIIDQQSSLMPAVFGQMNDYGFPVFPGVWLYGTTAWAEFDDPGSFATLVNVSTFPTTNDLPYNFYNVSHVAIIGGSDISGWYADLAGAELGGYGAYTLNSVVFWNSSDNLVAGNHFESQAGGVFLYGGTGNYLWGNYFDVGPVPNPDGSVIPTFAVTGIMADESGDHIYNNEVNATIPVVLLPYDDYTGAPVSYTELWNVALQPSSTVNFAPSWPTFPLNGTIFGTAKPGAVDQGGNYWWNYGSGSNPIGVLPYNDVISSLCGGPCIFGGGGDYHPLLPIVGYTITFSEVGLPAGSYWAVTMNGMSNNTTGTNNVFAQIVTGSYTFVVTGPPAYAASPASGTFSVDSAQTRTINFVAPQPTVGTVTGVVTPSSASVSVDGSAVFVGAGGVFRTNATAGIASIEAGATGFYSYFNNISLAGGGSVALAISLDPVVPPASPNGTLDGTVSPATASVTINGEPVLVGSYGSFAVQLAPGEYTLVAGAAGYATGTAVVTITSGHTTSAPPIVLTGISTSSNSTAASSSNSGIGSLGWGLIAALAVIVVILLAVALVLTRRGRPSPRSVASEESGSEVPTEDSSEAEDPGSGNPPEAG